MKNNYSSFNYNKYQSGNPLKKYLLNRFLETIKIEIKKIKPNSILDAGCGEGMVLSFISSIRVKRRVGIDLSTDALKMAKKNVKSATFRKMDATKIKYKDNAFDCVLILEVLEHLKNPEKAIREVKRVSGKWAIFSVPDEPSFTIMSLLSGKYLSRFGRHPEHINAWSSEDFHDLIKKHFKKTKLIKSFPWTIVVAQKIDE